MNPTLSGIIAILMWSTMGTILVFARELPTLELLGILFAIGALIMMGKQVVNREEMRGYWKRPWQDYAFWVIGAGGYTVLVYYAFALAPPFEANILNYLWPILLVIFSVIFHKEALTRNAAIGIVLGFLGMITLFLPANGGAFFADFRWGHALAICGAFFWATYSSMARTRSYPTGFLAAAFTVSAVLCIVAHFMFEKTVWPHGIEWLFIALLGFSRSSYAFWDYGMKHGNVILLASLSYLLPLASSLSLAMFGFGPDQPLIGIGAAMIIAGCLCVNAGHLKHMVQNFLRKT